MKKLFPQVLLCSLTLSTSSLLFAQTENFVYVPTLEDGITFSVGALYLVPTSDFESYFAVPSITVNETNFEVLNVNPDYQFGIDASIGYIFDETANGIDLFFRNISTSDNDTTEFEVMQEVNATVTGDLGYDLTAFDLMFSQYVNLGQYMETRLMAGVAYVELKQNRSSDLNNDPATPFNFSHQTSKYTGLGPRLGIDTRYDFFGFFGLVAGGSLAYYLGELDANTELSQTNGLLNASDTLDNHAVMNIRANIGFDMVFSNDDRDPSAIGLELGYLIDYYDDGLASENILGLISSGLAGEALSTSAVSFSGPYVNLKGVF